VEPEVSGSSKSGIVVEVSSLQATRNINTARKRINIVSLILISLSPVVLLPRGNPSYQILSVRGNDRSARGRLP